MIQVILFHLFCVSMLYVSFGQIPCDDAYGSHCAEHSGWGALACVKELDSLSESCRQYIALHDFCKDDIEKYCVGNEFTGDLLPCLTEWTPLSSLSPSCGDALPKKEETKEKKLTKEEKEKANKRRR